MRFQQRNVSTQLTFQPKSTTSLGDKFFSFALTKSGQPKISDFGMSRILGKAEEGTTQSGVGPICWMAPESIAHRNYSKQSDVWSFGIVVYEIVAQCEPHKDKDVFDVGVKIRDEGFTPEIPSNCPEKFVELMQMCWKKQPQQRPDFETICEMLEQWVRLKFRLSDSDSDRSVRNKSQNL